MTLRQPISNAPSYSYSPCVVYLLSNLIKSLIVADRIKTTPYKDIIKTVQTYNAPPPSPIVQKYRFNTRVRAPGET